MKKRAQVTRNCEYCNKSFTTILSRIASGKGKYCSRLCFDTAKTTTIEKVCRWCSNRFKVKQSNRNQMFCSKPCWYAWHKGENNSIYKRVDVNCDNCGKSIKRNPYRIEHQQHQYCSRKCASSHHGKIMTGNKHWAWTGGRTLGRGSAWHRIRTEILTRDNYQCVECGISQADHLEKYRRPLTVHHIEPYRLHFNNDLSNLITLCVRCHRRIENRTVKKLSPEDLALMVVHSEQNKAINYHEHYQTYYVDNCPTCHKPKYKESKLCRKCSDATKAEQAKKRLTCPQCGKAMSNYTAKICWQCHVFNKRQRGLK